MLRRPADRRGQAVILVAGATGHVGSQLVRLLAEGGTPARALIHSPEKAAPIQRLGLETALGDFEQTDTLDAAMAGCDHLFLLSPPSPRQPEQEQHVIDARDIAAVAARVLTSPGHQGTSYTLTGPESLSAAEVAERLSAAIGRQVRYVNLPPDAFGQALAGAGLPGWLVDALVVGNTLLAAGDGATVTDEVARLTGRPPRTFDQFAADNRTAFGG